MPRAADQGWSFETPSTWTWTEDTANLAEWTIDGAPVRVGIMVHDKPLSLGWRRGRIVIVSAKGRITTVLDGLELPPDHSVMLRPGPPFAPTSCLILTSLQNPPRMIVIDAVAGGVTVQKDGKDRFIPVR